VAPGGRLLLHLQICNYNFSAMALDEGLGALRASRPAKSSARKKQQVIIVGNFLLQGMETTICEPDLLWREVCFSPRACIGTLLIEFQGLSVPLTVAYHCSLLWAPIIL